MVVGKFCGKVVNLSDKKPCTEKRAEERGADGKCTYGRKSADRTEPHFGVIFFVFLSTFFGNLEVCDVKTCNIF